MPSRSPQGECGLKLVSVFGAVSEHGRSPQGECGLKSPLPVEHEPTQLSLPARGVWIEMISKAHRCAP